MTAQPDFERLIQTFLEDGPTELPGRSYDTVRAVIEHTRQRVVIGPWRVPDMNNFAKFALAAVAIVAVAAVGMRFLPGGNGTGTGPSPTAVPTMSPSPSPMPTPSPSPIALPAGDLPAGTYVARPFLGALDGISFTFAVPDGWSAGGPPGRNPVFIAPTTGFVGPTGMQLGFLTVDGLERDPCNWNPGTDAFVGSSVEDLVSALAANPSYDTSDPTNVTLGGFAGRRIDVELPADLDLHTCDGEQFWIWSAGDGQSIYAQGPRGRFHLWILDVQGRRVLVMTHDFPGTPAADRAELQEIVDSIRIEVEP